MSVPKAIRNDVIIQPFIQGGSEGYTTTGGIYIPANVEEKKVGKASTARALVCSVGPGVSEVKEGDEVIYNKYAAKPMGDIPYFSINVNEIFAVVS